MENANVFIPNVRSTRSPAVPCSQKELQKDDLGHNWELKDALQKCVQAKAQALKLDNKPDN